MKKAMYGDLKKRNNFGPLDPISSDGEKLDHCACESANMNFFGCYTFFLN